MQRIMKYNTSIWPFVVKIHISFVNIMLLNMIEFERKK